MSDITEALKIAAQLGVRGRVGAYVIQWSFKGRRVVIYLYHKPSVAPSPAQIRVREAMRQAMAEYEELPEDARDALHTRGEGVGLSGTALYAQERIPQLV